MLTVQETLSIGRLAEARVKAGKSGLGRTINTVTVMDIPEIAEWLTGGELVIAGVLFQQCFSRELVDALNSKGIAGLVTKEKFTGFIPQSLFNYCDEIGFPIILAPADCNWGQIMNPIVSHIIREPYVIIQEAQKFHYTLMRSVIEGTSLSDICTEMYKSAGMNLAVMDNDLHLLGFSNSFDWKACTRRLTPAMLQYSGTHFQTLDENSIYIYSYTNMLLRSIKLKLLFYPVTLNYVKYGYIVLAIDENVIQPKPTEIMKIQQLGLFVALHSTKQSEINNATRRFNSLLMDRLLQDNALTQEKAEALLAPMDKKIHRQYYAVHILYDEIEDISSFVLLNNRIGIFHAAVEKQVSQSEHILFFEKPGAQIIMLPHPIDDLDTILYQLRSIFLETMHLTKAYVGVSEPMPLAQFKRAYRQSAHGANYLRSLNSDRQYCKYSELGVIKYFMDNEGRLDEGFLRSTYERYITPLVKHDEVYNTQLLYTLERYIGNNCSKVVTEQELFIHKNTLRARLSAIGKLLDCNIDSVDDLFNLQLALKLRYFFDNTDL